MLESFLEHYLVHGIVYYYFVGVALSLVLCVIYIVTEVFVGRIIKPDLSVVIGITFYAVVSWVGVVVYIYCIGISIKHNYLKRH